MRIERIWLIGRWALVIGLLGAGLLLLIGFWSAFNHFGVVRRLAYPQGWHAEVSFWYAFPGFQAGLLVGLFVGFARSNIRRLLLVLHVAVWAELAVNLGIIAWLVSRGALF